MYARELADFTAWKKFAALVYAQDRDTTAFERIPSCTKRLIHPLRATAAGTVRKMNAEAIGRAFVFLGAGRAQSHDDIDYAIGLSQIKKVGERIEANEPLVFVHAREHDALGSVLPLLAQAIARSNSGRLQPGWRQNSCLRLERH